MNPLELRVAQLEKNLKAYRIFFSTFIIVAVSVSFMAFVQKSKVPEVIQAKSFEVVDNYGNVLAKLNIANNNGQLSTYTPSGKRLVSLMTTNDGSAGAINTYDTNGNLLFKLTKTIGGGGYLALFNGDSKEVSEFGVTTGGTGYLKINDRNANKIAWITQTDVGGGYFSLSNGNNTEIIRISSTEAGGRINVYNKNEIRIGYLGAQDNGDGQINTWNNDGTVTGYLPN